MKTLPIEKAQFCFATLALGKRYRILAQELAKDIEQYSPQTPFLILTDNPQAFKSYPNVLAFKHQQRLWCDNDKSILIGKALSLFDCCICIDADMKILSPVALDIEKFPVGITARSCCSLIKHTTKRTPQPQKLAVLEKVAQKLDLDLKNEDIKWIHEFLFIVKKGTNQEHKFVKLCEMISRYIELNNVQIGAGSAIGLAAAKLGIPIRHDTLEGIDFFKDRVELERAKKGQTISQKMLPYFEKVQSIEYPKYPLLQKSMVKLYRLNKDLRRSIRLRVDTFADLNFYYL